LFFAGSIITKLETTGGEGGRWEFRMVSENMTILMSDGHRTTSAGNPFVVDPKTGEISIESGLPSREVAAFYAIPVHVVPLREDGAVENYTPVEGQ
jgi:hypothetical protein